MALSINITDLMASDNINTIFDIIEQEGGTAKFVGGCVRDSLIKRDICDIDIATNLLPEKVSSIFHKNGIQVIETGLQHGTVTVVVNKFSCEITTLRKDVNCDGRHAEVEYVDDWKIDAERRDFTFNALYCNRNGIVLDYFNGVSDLDKGILRFVNDAEKRVIEDYLRILRAFRFYMRICSYKSKLSKEILEVSKKYHNKLNDISGERIKNEMFKLFSYKGDLLYVLSSMEECSVLQVIGLKYKDTVKSYIDNIDKLKDRDPIIILSILIRNIEDIDINFIINRWKLSRSESREIKEICNCDINIFYDNKKHIRKYGKLLYTKIIKVYFTEGYIDQDKLNELIDLVNTWIVPEFMVTGKDLLNLGVTPGIMMGKILKELEMYWEENNYIDSKEDLLIYYESNIK